ncbi:class I SAM-dependent methyltransferase [Pseudorhodoplanes sinuspersici]|uniref:Uncharacterized protein n=1 Tax=Pseudorhodoplanes sinuspersici TaxID=1235591 RepID=A0A1W6ZYV8_9HYPH|nr:class I SAM-dependent methyltransferase [Pseudorhodoplanes sinuspersici]ARQ02331.1 hypothetical protein CAK95_26925 [Pseudorhodoplanes sinuspersici]RKE74159.1 methyltransferase family protein [Pseudorhodoplanes sinuspersici]
MTIGFEEAAWLFNSHISNRGHIRQDFNEAALLWKATRTSRGPILEIGRYQGGSTVLLLMAGEGRHITSIDLNPRHLPECDEYFRKPEIARRLTLITGNSRIPIPGAFGFMFVDGDHSYEGVKTDICAQWNSLTQFEGIEPTIVFHDAVENTQAHNSGSTHHTGVQAVCNELIACGAAQRLETAGSSLWMKKLADLPARFRGTGRSS